MHEVGVTRERAKVEVDVQVVMVGDIPSMSGGGICEVHKGVLECRSCG